MMRMGHKKRRALRQIGVELRREDPLLASMLSEDNDVPIRGHHPEDGKLRRRRAGDASGCRSPYTPFIMF
jgi:hypothetical protein